MKRFVLAWMLFATFVSIILAICGMSFVIMLADLEQLTKWVVVIDWISCLIRISLGLLLVRVWIHKASQPTINDQSASA